MSFGCILILFVLELKQVHHLIGDFQDAAWHMCLTHDANGFFRPEDLIIFIPSITNTRVITSERLFRHFCVVRQMYCKKFESTFVQASYCAFPNIVDLLLRLQRPSALSISELFKV
jgi:hypothetical protein